MSGGPLSTLPSEVQCEKQLSKCYVGLQQLIHSFEKGSTADLSGRIRHVETDIEHLRDSVKNITDIGSEEAKQRAKIKDLYRQIKLKDELIESFVKYDIVDGTATQPELVDGSKNPWKIHCSQCPSTVLLPNAAVWVQRSFDLPLVRQQKERVGTAMESLTGFWEVRDMYDFENVGFTHSVDGVKYLTCADCEFGPIGMVDTETKTHFVADQRLCRKTD